MLCVGRKGYDQLRRDYARQIIERVDLKGVKQVSFANAHEIAGKLRALFEAGEFDVATLYFAEFKSVISQKPTALQLIPVKLPVETAAADGAAAPAAVYEYEPDEAEVLDYLLPRNIAAQIFRGLLENAASEQGARMSAMDSRHPQRRRHDRQADDALQPRAPGQHHQGADRDHLRRRGAVENVGRVRPKAVTQQGLAAKIVGLRAAALTQPTREN